MMGDTIQMFVRPLRGVPGNAGHAYFVYTHDNDPPQVLSLTSANGMLGINGGLAQVNRGIYQRGQVDFPRDGENHVLVDTIHGQDLSGQWATMNSSFDASGQNPYFFQSQNSNAAAARALSASGQDTTLPLATSPYSLPGWNYYQNRSEINGDPNYFSYYDGQGGSGTLRVASNGSLVEETYTARDGTRIDTTPSGSDYHTQFSDSAGRTYATETVHPNGSYDNISYNVAGSQPWASLTQSYDANDSLIGTVRTYTDGDAWFTSHQLDPVRLANFDESAVSAFTQEVERDSFHGSATPSAAPDVLSYEPQFGPGYDFNSGNFDIDSTPFSPAAPDLSVEGVSPGFDYSWLNNWDYGWEVSSFDGWDYGDSWDPVVLDLDGSGIDITNRTDSTVYFDVDGDGYREQTAWAGPNDGLLVIDLAAARSFPRRKLITGVEGGAHYLRAHRAQRSNTRLSTVVINDPLADEIVLLYRG
jgi:hypothetical protein